MGAGSDQVPSVNRALSSDQPFWAECHHPHSLGGEGDYPVASGLPSLWQSLVIGEGLAF